MSPGPLCAGADIARGKWVVALVAAGSVRWVSTQDLREILDSDVAMLGVDIPIGLPAIAPRSADQQARAALVGATSRVFMTPSRAVVEDDRPAGDPQLQALARATGGAGVSAQALALRSAIGHVDTLLRSAPEYRARVVEVHPELSFLAMTGAVLAAKKSAVGTAQRVRALAAAANLDVWSALECAPSGVAIDDCLDALAAAWSAQRFAAGRAIVRGDGIDAYGIAMRIAS